MTKEAPNDDFFGIEYISSMEAQERQKKQETLDNSSNEAKQLSGSKFLDDTFFPEFSKVESKVVDSEPKNTGTDFLDDAFFPGLSDSRSQPRKSDEFYEEIGQHLQRNRFQQLPQEELSSFQIEKKFRQHDEFYEKYRQERVHKEEPTLKEGKKPLKSVKFVKNTIKSENESPSALSKIRSTIFPVWTLTDEQLVEYLAERIIFSDSNFIAFDKPYGLRYSGTRDESIPQFDRILQSLKFRVAPKVERLYLVRSLDKDQSGVILFATSKLAKSEAVDMLKNTTLTHRCLVRGSLSEPIEVTIPLVKKITGVDMKLHPLLTNKAKGDASYGTTLLTSLKTCENISYIQAETKNEVPHQLRCHLSLAKIPLIGDRKYGNNEEQPPRLPNKFLHTIGINQNQARKLPYYSHLMQMNLPSPSGKQQNISIHAPLPSHFIWMLKRLKFLHR